MSTDTPIMACIDVAYRGDSARSAALWFTDWQASAPIHENVVTLNDVAPYQPGEFYRRELPCLLSVLRSRPTPAMVVIDGYVELGPGRPGLGSHLYDALQKQVPVIGVAKTRFFGAVDAIEICRGESKTPLFITAVGVSAVQAGGWIAGMHGPYRLPTLLRRVDQLSRAGV